jgi:hypothetical protein
VSGVRVDFPYGSLSTNATISMQPAGSLSIPAFGAGLGSDVSFTGAGPAVNISSSPAQNTANPFVLSIPFPSQTSLAGNLENLVVLFEERDAKTNQSRFVHQSSKWEINS